MNKFKKTFLYLFFLIFFIITFFLSLYLFLIYKPERAVNFIDKALIYDYSFKITSIESNKNLLSPNFLLTEIKINDNYDNEVIYIPKFKIGINIIESLIQNYLSLNILEINSIKFSESRTENASDPFLIKGNKLKINNKDIQITSDEYEILFESEEIKIVLLDGKINNYIYTSIDALIDSKSETLFYTSKHSFNNNELKEIEFVDFSSLKEHDINLNLVTKGFINFANNKSKRVDKLTFIKSDITTKTEFKIENIELELFTNTNGGLSGFFTATIPNQDISGNLLVNEDQSFEVRTNLEINMGGIIDSNRYFGMSGKEVFSSILKITQNNLSMKLFSDLERTKISSSIKEIEKKISKNKATSIYIEDMSNPIYEINSKYIQASIDRSGRGYFSFGNGFNNEIQNQKHNNGFYIYLNLDSFNLDDIFYDRSSGSSTLLKSIKIKSNSFNFFNNKYADLLFDIAFKEEIIISILGDNLNGLINIDKTNFIKIELKNTQFNFDGIDLAQSEIASDIDNISLRLIGRNIKTSDDLFQDVDFYLLKNKNILTVDNINITSERLKIAPDNDGQKAYISYNNKKDLYKIKGNYRFDNSSGYFNSLTNYNFNFFETDLNIQWNSLDELVNLEGKLDFLIKDLNLDTEMPESTFLRALRIFNLNGIIEGLDNVSNDSLNVNRASGRLLIGKNRAVINTPIIFETDEASMKWKGEILKNKKGQLDELNLDLAMRLKISENIPWYAALFGGMPALAGGVVLENIFEDTIEDVSTINFEVHGTIKKPEIKRLN